MQWIQFRVIVDGSKTCLAPDEETNVGDVQPLASFNVMQRWSLFDEEP